MKEEVRVKKCLNMISRRFNTRIAYLIKYEYNLTEIKFFLDYELARLHIFIELFSVLLQKCCLLCKVKRKIND